MNFSEVFSFLKKDTNTDLIFWKDKKSGKMRFLCGYSSNYIDDDNPPDILSAKAHKKFINKVNSRELPYPTFRLWHIKGTDIGVADYLFYDEEFGIAMATGTIDEQYESIAKAIQKSKEVQGVSHGMSYYVRNEKDTKVIDEYVTIEISVLPLVAAANKMTSIIIKENDNMTISDKQKEYLRDKGLSSGLIAALDAKNKGLADENADRLRKSKEKEAEKPKEEAPEADVAKETTAEETLVVEEEVTEAEAETEEEVPVEDEIADEDADKVKKELNKEEDKPSLVTMKQMESTVEYLVKTLGERLDKMNADIEALANKNTELEKSVNDGALTPGASLSRIIHEGLTQKSVKNETESTDKEDPLLKDSPDETPATEESTGIAGVIKRIVGE